MLALIAAMAHNRIIGRNGRIPWELPEDMRSFRALTMGHIIVMGRKTYEEIGRPLPGRETIVVSRTKNFDEPHCVTVPDLGAALRLAGEQDIYICGGAQLYREALPLADVLYLTEIDAEIDGDTVFPQIPQETFVEVEREPYTEDALPFAFVTYTRKELTYAQARERLAALTAQKGIILGLTPLKALLHRLGDPQDTVPAVHLAGTNGKGSTLAMTAAMLREAGYRVGTYSSPAVFHERECWKLNERMISEGEYAAWMTVLLAVCDDMRANGQPTPTAFELETALAFCWFAACRCQIMVIECGMGGEEDATNVLTSTAVSVLTSIGMEHMKFLGNSLTEIARTKGGIVKAGVPVVLQGQNETVEAEISRICAEKNSPLTIVCGNDSTILEENTDGTTFLWNGERFHIPLCGAFQVKNAMTAMTAVRQLKAFPMDMARIQRGLENVVWHGRLEQIADHPVILLDGAHNPNAAEQLCAAMHKRCPAGGLIEIVGVLADKDFTEVGRLMAPLARKIITVTPHNPRALAADELAQCLRAFCADVTAADSVEQALSLAQQVAGEQGTILAYGSLSWLGEMRRAVEELQ